MKLAPPSVADLQSQLAHCRAAQQRVTGWDLKELNRVLRHTPEDMTVTVESGITLADLQAALGRHNQWIPIDPPASDALSVHDLLAFNRSGPRRFGYGPVRDHVIGLRAVLGDGRLIHSGGQVVKNVAGYDLLKLFIGGAASLGIITEVTFKLLPQPEAEAFVIAECESIPSLERLVEAVHQSPLAPVSFDAFATGESPRTFRVSLGFAGPREDVQWQLSGSVALGFHASAGTDPERDFWNQSTAVSTISVLPSRVVETIGALAPHPFVARVGNGLIYTRARNHASYETDTPANTAAIARDASVPAHGIGVVIQRLKSAFDPACVLPQCPV